MIVFDSDPTAHARTVRTLFEHLRENSLSRSFSKENPLAKWSGSGSQRLWHPHEPSRGCTKFMRGRSVWKLAYVAPKQDFKGENSFHFMLNRHL